MKDSIGLLLSAAFATFSLVALTGCATENAPAASTTVTVTATTTAEATIKPTTPIAGPAPEIAAALEEACTILATGGEPSWDDMIMLGPTSGQTPLIGDISRKAERAEDLYLQAIRALDYSNLYSLQGSTEYGMLLQDVGTRLNYASTLRATTRDYLEGDRSRETYDRILYFLSAYTASIELRLRGCPL